MASWLPYGTTLGSCRLPAPGLAGCLGHGPKEAVLALGWAPGGCRVSWPTHLSWDGKKVARTMSPEQPGAGKVPVWTTALLVKMRGEEGLTNPSSGVGGWRENDGEITALSCMTGDGMPTGGERTAGARTGGLRSAGSPLTPHRGPRGTWGCDSRPHSHKGPYTRSHKASQLLPSHRATMTATS